MKAYEKAQEAIDLARQAIIQLYIDEGCLSLDEAAGLNASQKEALGSSVLRELYLLKKLTYQQILNIHPRALTNLNQDANLRNQYENDQIPFELLEYPGIQFYIGQACFTFEQYQEQEQQNADLSTKLQMKLNLNSSVLRTLFINKELTFEQVRSMSQESRENLELKEQIRKRFEESQSAFENGCIRDDNVSPALPLFGYAVDRLAQLKKINFDATVVRSLYACKILSFQEIYDAIINHTDFTKTNFSTLVIDESTPAVFKKIANGITIRKNTITLFFKSFGADESLFRLLGEDIKFKIGALTGDSKLHNEYESKKIAEGTRTVDIDRFDFNNIIK